jgi:hypothetical protein
MAAILSFFSDYSILIYFLLLVGGILAGRSLSRARHELDESTYGLEIQAAHKHSTRAISALSLIILLALSELVLTVILAPNMPALFIRLTPTLNVLSTPTNTLSPELLATIGIFTPVAITTSQATGCLPGQIMISFPKPGDVVKGQVMLMGTATIPNFGFYKYEFSPLGFENWSTIQANNLVIIDGELGLWNTSEISPGDYNLRLVVTDNQTNARPPCVVPVRISAP